MDLTLLGVVAGGLVLAGVTVWLVDRRLARLAERLDHLAGAHGDLPRQLAEGGTLQARALAEVRERLAGLEHQARHLESLGDAVEDIRQIVAVPRLRGALGELWLEELLGDVLPASHWERQHAFATGERVDAVIRVGDRLVPVDAKFPLEACRRMLAADGDERDREARAFGRAVRARVDEIAERYIRPEEGTFPFALMYVPAEGVYWEAVRLDEDVLAYARERRVVLVSPNTFFAYLQAIAHGLRGLTVEARARELLDGLSGLRQELARFDGTVDLARRHLQNAARQIEDLGRIGGELDRRLRGFTDETPRNPPQE